MRHDNYGDMNYLSGLVLRVPTENKLKFAANVLGAGLMRGPWWMRAMHGIVSRLRGWNATVTWYLLLNKMGRIDLVDDIIASFSRHIYHGKDLSDTRSVGGLNQQEVNATVNLLSALGDDTARAALGDRPHD